MKTKTWRHEDCVSFGEQNIQSPVGIWGSVRESCTAGQKQTHSPRAAKTFAAASCRKTWHKQQESGRLKRVAVVHGGVRCSDVQGTASHRKRQKPEKKQEGEREEKQKAVSREGLSPVRMHRTSNCLRRAPDGACALSTSSPRRLLTA